MNTRRTLIASLAGLALAAPASAAGYTIDWLQMAPTAFGSAPINGASYNLPGVGLVQVSWTSVINFTESRLDQNPNFFGGSVSYGGDTYGWTNIEQFARANWQPAPPVNQSWDITYTFPTTVAAGSIILGVSGLGRQDAGVPGAVSTATVAQNGTYLGEYFGGGPWGPNLYTSGTGWFSLENAVTGVGGANPHWNTALALVRIDDAVNSLTVRFVQTSGDGVGLDIGVLVPTPGAAALLGLAGVAGLRRRRA